MTHRTYTDGVTTVRHEPISEEQHNEPIERFLSYFEHPETAPWDWRVLGDIKRRAWRHGNQFESVWLAPPGSMP